MLLIDNNLYGVLGILVGTTARGENRQAKRLIHYIESEEISLDNHGFNKLNKISLNVMDIESFVMQNVCK
jgi:hypothetical protein